MAATSLRNIVQMMRDAKEKEVDEERNAWVLFLRREGPELFNPALPLLEAEIAGDDMLLIIREVMTMPVVDGVAFFLDTWGYPRDIWKTLAKEREELAAEFGEDSEQVRHFLDGKPRPSDFPVEERTEASVYMAAGTNGEFVGACQLRGLHHELLWTDEENDMDGSLRYMMGYLGVKLRAVMEGVI